MIWLLILFAWTFCAMLAGCVLGLVIHERDHREQPSKAEAEAIADFEQRRVSGWM